MPERSTTAPSWLFTSKSGCSACQHRRRQQRMPVRSGITLIKYWFSISDEEQHLRFQMRIHDPIKQWKLSPMDLEPRRRWEDYTKAKEAMLSDAADKKRRETDEDQELSQSFERPGDRRAGCA